MNGQHTLQGLAIENEWLMVPPRGFEPLISTLKGWRPGPLDDGGMNRCQAKVYSIRRQLLTRLRKAGETLRIYGQMVGPRRLR